MLKGVLVYNAMPLLGVNSIFFHAKWGIGWKSLKI